jgi:hypothetical protein
MLTACIVQAVLSKLMQLTNQMKCLFLYGINKQRISNNSYLYKAISWWGRRQTNKEDVLRTGQPPVGQLGAQRREHFSLGESEVLRRHDI